MIDTYIKLLQAHEKLLALGAVLVFLFVVTGKVLQEWDAHDSHIAAADVAKLAADTQQTAQLTAQLADVKTQVATAERQLQAAIASRDAALVKQKQTDATLTAVQTATHLNSQLGVTDIAAQDDTVVLPLDDARTITADLDELPVVKADLVDVQKQFADEQSKSAAYEAVLQAQAKQLADANATCKAQVAELNVKVKHSFWRGFKYGFLTGATLGLWSGHSI